MLKIKNFIVHRSSFIVFMLVALIYFTPLWKDRQIPFPGHLLISFFSPWKEEAWDGYPAGVPRKDLLGFDTVRMMGPWRKFVTDELRAGRLPTWNPHQFMGAPLLANSQSAVWFPPNWLYLVLPFSIVWTLFVISQPAIAFFSMRAFLLASGSSHVASSLVALLYAFSGWMTVWIEWNIHGFVYALLSLLLFFIHQKRSLRSVIVGSLIVFAGHPQMAAIALIAAALYALAMKRFLWFTKAGVLVGVITAMQWWPMIQYYKEAGRERESAEFSYRETLFEWSQLPRLVAPNIFGNPATENYSGQGNFVETTAYIGVALVVFALYGITDVIPRSTRLVEAPAKRARNPYRSLDKPGMTKDSENAGLQDDQGVRLWYPLLLLFLIVLFALPNPFSIWVGERHIPILSTSVASRWLMLFPLAVSMLGAGGFDRVSKGLALRPQGQAFLRWPAALKGRTFPQGPTFFGFGKDQTFRKNLILQDWPVVFISLVFALFWFWALSGSDSVHLVARRNLMVPTGIVGASIVGIWLWLQATGYKLQARKRTSTFSTYSLPVSCGAPRVNPWHHWIRCWGEHPAPRAFGSENHSPTDKSVALWCVGSLLLVAISSVSELILFAHKTMTYTELRFLYPDVPVIKKLQELTQNGERFGSTEGSAIESNFATWFGLYDVAGYDALYPKSVGELVWASHRQGDFEWDYPRSTVVSPTVKDNWRDRFWTLAGVKWILHKDDNVDLAKRGHNSSLFEEDRFRLVWSEGKWQIYESLLAFPRAFFISNESWIGEGQKMIQKIYTDPLPEITPATIEVYEPTRVVISVEAPSDGYLVLTDTFYPEWEAIVDDASVGILPAFHSFRGVKLTPGEHQLVFEFKW